MKLRSSLLGITLAAMLAASACGSSTAKVGTGAGATTTTAAAKATITTMNPKMDHGGGSHDSGQPAATSGHHHNDSKITYAELGPETKAQVDVVIKWAKKYKTGADAAKDGWKQATKSLYGIGAHWIKGGATGFLGFKGDFDPTMPNVLLFDGEGPTAKLAGLSWILSGPTDPAGFAGPDDHWHRHSSICFVIKDFLVISEGDAEGSPINLSKAGCKRNGGMLFPIDKLTMMHLWIGDGYMDGPLFSHDNSHLLNGYRPNENPTAS